MKRRIDFRLARLSATAQLLIAAADELNTGTDEEQQQTSTFGTNVNARTGGSDERH
jgi:hypothetical protein